jgi:hypothetical protein
MAQDHQSPSIITLTTDFGLGSRYIGAMKGVILSTNPRATIVDLSHCVPPRDIRAGAIVLAETAPWYDSHCGGRSVRWQQKADRLRANWQAAFRRA